MRRLETWVAASLVVMLSGGVGCGESSDDQTSSSQKTTKAAGGAGNGATETAIVPLEDDKAGIACAADKDCGSGMCLTSIPGSLGAAAMDAPGGYCSGSCTTNADCGNGGACSGAIPSFGGGAPTAGKCFKACAGEGDCRDGYRCVNGLGMAATGGGAMQASMVAVPGAMGAMGAMGGLPAGFDISALLGPNVCQPKPATVQLAADVSGKPCEQDGECGKGRCMKTDGMMTFPGGICTGSCLKDADCGGNGSCALPLFGGGAGNCYMSCQSNGDLDCREGYRCRSNGGRRQCLPGAPALGADIAGRECAADADCGASAKCNTMLGGQSAPGGYCSQTCGEDSDCGEGGVCVGGVNATFASLLGPMPASGTCYRGCSATPDCRKGYTCGQPTMGAAATDPAAAALGGMPSSSVCFVATAGGEDAGVP